MTDGDALYNTPRTRDLEADSRQKEHVVILLRHPNPAILTSWPAPLALVSRRCSSGGQRTGGEVICQNPLAVAASRELLDLPKTLLTVSVNILWGSAAPPTLNMVFRGRSTNIAVPRCRCRLLLLQLCNALHGFSTSLSKPP